MGALLSLPLLAVPSVTTIMSFAASCCGAATCSMVCSACGKCGNSVATRVGYALLLLVNSIIAWIMLTPWAIEKLQHLMLDYVKINCPTGSCHGWVAVHRINFALGIFHLILAGLLFGVSSSKHPRAIPTPWIMSFAASCCGAATCSMVCSACGKCGNSVATRVGYALLLLVNSIIAWIMLTPWAIEKLQHLMLDYVKINCPTGSCHGWVAVHRINFALGIFHLILAGLLFGVSSSKHPRAAIQNGYWGPKIIAWFALVVMSFLIPDPFFVFWGNYIAFAGAMLFLMLGLILLVDLAHNWAEYCLAQIEETDSRVWRFVLIGSTLGMYLGSIAMTVVQYVFFARGPCSLNQAAITINLVLWLAVSVISVNPSIQEYNSKAGLAQAAMVAVYCTYLTMSAVSMEPDDKQCNPLVRAQGTRTTSVVIGAIVTMLTVAYTTTRAATQSLGLGNSNGIRLPEEDEHDLVTQQPAARREMRAEALRRAVEEGSLPAEALLSDDEDSDAGDHSSHDDERSQTQYNYTVFHIIFFLATAWVATLLTMNFEEATKEGDFATVGRTYAASYVKIASSWICYGMYTWTLVAPIVLPDRFDFS